MSHVGGDEDGGEDVTEDEDADDGQQSVHAVLQRPGGEGYFIGGYSPDDGHGDSYEMVCSFHHF